MHRKATIMNACVVPNRGCNLRCEHCYIETELLSSKGHITEENYRLIFDRTEELYDLDQRVKKIAIEILGGEITMMPLEWWKRNLPYALEKSRQFALKTGVRTASAFCTNMILKDDGYIDLFNSSFDDPNFDLFISWEPDTGRYGKGNKLEKRWKEAVSKVDSRNTKCICLIPTKGLIEDYGVDRLFSEIIIPMKIKDVSTDMLYQFGAGAEFFRSGQPTFKQVADWYIDLHKKTEELGIKGLTLSPREEIYGCLLKDDAFHCMGNDLYDIEFEPDGTTTLNSSMTGSEAMAPSRTLQITDDLWAVKFLFENTSEMNKKFSNEYDFCFQCEYLSYCNGGYYHYHMLPEERLSQLMADGECPGFKSYWDYCNKKLGNDRPDMGELRHLNRVKDIVRSKGKPKPAPYCEDDFHCESDYKGYDQFFQLMSTKPKSVLIENELHLGKSLAERIWFYDSLGIPVSISDELFFSSRSTETLIKQVINDNYINFSLSPDQCLSWANKNPDSKISKIIVDALSVVNSIQTPNTQEGYTVTSCGLIVDTRNEEVFRWATSIGTQSILDVPELELSPSSYSYVKKMKGRLRSEADLIGRYPQ